MKAQSSIVAELLLIAISVALIAVVVGVVNTTVGRVASLALPTQLPTPAGVYDLMPAYDSTNGKVLALVLRVKNPVTLTGVRVYYGEELVCSFDHFVLSSSSPVADQYGCEALVPAGYYGQLEGQADDYDALCPGALYFKVGCDKPVKAISVLEVDNGWYSPEGAPPWATVGTFVPSFIPLGSVKCETRLSNSTGTLEFQERLGAPERVLYNGTDWLYAVPFKSVRLYKGTYTLLLWCPSLNVPLEDLKIVVSTDVTELTVRPPRGGLI